MADSPDSESAKNHPEVSKGEESHDGNPEVSSRERRRHRASLARHSRKCSVCHHPDREFIDDDYLRWLSPKKIARQYKISHHSVVYRHADATGLRTQRRAAVRATLEHFIEQAENVRVTAHSIVSAVRLYSQINDQGQYTPSVRRHIVEHHYFNSPADAGLPGDPAPPIANAAGTAATASPATASEPAARQETIRDGSPSTTFAAPSAAPLAEAQKNSGPVNKTGGSPPVATTVANSAAPLSESGNKFGAGRLSPRVTGSSPPVATAIAGSAMPSGESPENFPAVSVATAPAPTKSKITATPIATIYLQTNAISNRELLGLDHVATR
jgi:hypothetical protein